MSSLRELCLDDNELESEGAVIIAEGVKVRCAHTSAAELYIKILSMTPLDTRHSTTVAATLLNTLHYYINLPFTL